MRKIIALIVPILILGLLATAHSEPITLSNVWVTETDNNRVIKLDHNGNMLLSVNANDPYCISVNSNDGTVWIGDRGLNQLIKFDSNGNELLRLNGIFSYSSPSAVAVNPVEGTVWASNYGRYGVVKLDLDGNVLLEVNYKFLYIIDSGMSVNTTDGSIWIASEDFNNIGSYAVIKLSSEGIELFKIGGLSARPSVSVDPNDSSVWIATGDVVIKLDSEGHELFRISGFNNPVDVSVNPNDGSVWVADNYNHRVVRIDNNGNIVASAWSGNPSSIATDPVDGSVWVADLVTSVDGVLNIDADGTELLRVTGLGMPMDISVESLQEQNDPPILETIGSSWVYEGNELIINLQATDPDGDPIIFDAIGLPSGANFDGNLGVFSWIPTHSQEGVYAVTFTVSDGYLEDNEIVNITVFDGDGPPIRKKKVVRKKPQLVAERMVVKVLREELESTFSVSLSFENLYPEKSDVTVTTFEECPKSSVGFQVDNACFDISTAATSFDFVEICLIYDDTTFNSEKNLSLEHFENNHWADITTTFDAEANLICGTSTTLSPFSVIKSVGEIMAPTDPQPVNNPVAVSAEFIDQDIARTHRAEIQWGDGFISNGAVSEVDGSGTAGGSHAYAAAGVYTVILTVYDDLNYLLGESDYQYVVVYDPDGGFVTGGGWINSPEGAFAADPILAGKAYFGFVSKYKKGATAPIGNTEFEFKVANLLFKSDSYDWLVISGPQAQFKGEGTINDSGYYGFMLSAIDGEMTGGNNEDKFRIKIWDRSTEAIIYDSMMNRDENDSPDRILGGGAIVIHKDK